MNRLKIILFLLISVSIVFSQIESKKIKKETKINVSVVGLVENPGTFVLTEASRVSQAIAKTGGFLENASRRKIQLVCGDDIRTVDLGRFFTFGDNSENPFVSDGCVIQVPQKQGVVAISGAVNRPGNYELLSGEKLYDIIQLAMGIAKDAHLKKVEIVRFVNSTNDTEILSASLSEILKNQDSHENILLYPDDHIFVKHIPNYHKKEPMNITLFGGAKKPGKMEIPQGFRLFDVITSAGGFSKNAKRDSVEIVRYLPDGIAIETIYANIEKITQNLESDQNILLQDGDRIFIKQNKDYHLHQSVSISGEVKFPGVFTIEDGETRLFDIIEKAGGVTQNADLSLGQIIRQAWIVKEDPTATIVGSFPSMDMEGMFSFVDFNYLKLTHRHQKGIISVDFEKLINGDDDDQNIFLRSGDQITIPKKGQMIQLLGMVKKPGLIPYEPGKKISYYVKKAGGYIKNVDKSEIRIINPETGIWIKVGQREVVMLGDTIFIPEKPQIIYWDMFKDLLSVASQAVTLYIIIQKVIE